MKQGSLSALRDELKCEENRLARYQANLKEWRIRDPDADGGVPASEQEVMSAQIGLSQSRILSLKRAITRGEEGNSSICIRCGGEIEKDRLEALPDTVWCINCAKDAESKRGKRRVGRK